MPYYMSKESDPDVFQSIIPPIFHYRTIIAISEPELIESFVLEIVMNRGYGAIWLTKLFLQSNRRDNMHYSMKPHAS